MRVKIFMDTIDQAKKIENIAKSCEQPVFIKDNTGLCVNAKSLVGILYAMEFVELWLESEGDYYDKFKDYIMGSSLEDNDSVVLSREP
jgi:hypothetical protein